MTLPNATRCALIILVNVLLAPIALQAAPLDTRFTYQGDLARAGLSAGGPHDFTFELFDTDLGGAPVAAIVTLNSVPVNDGVFSVALDFGAEPFAGDALWLEISVAASGSGVPLTTLTPRQPLRVTPYALHAEYVAMDAIGSLEIQDNTVGASDLAAGAVGTNEIAANAVTSQAIASGAVGSDEVADDALAAVDLAADSVGASELADASVDEAAIVDGAVTRTKLAPGAVGAAQVDQTQVQARVSGVCPVGRMLRGVNADGSAVCGVPNKLQLLDNSLDNGAGDGAGFNSTMAIGLDGLPVIAYPTNESGFFILAILKCNDSACSGGDEVPLLIDTMAPASFPFLTIGSDGIPVVAFTQSSLQLARCTDQDCTAVMISVVDVGPGSMGNASVAIGTDGFPVIAYRKGDTLSVAKCNDLACSGDDESISVVDADALSVDNTVVIGADGLPIIAYASFSEFTFRVAKCNDPACSGQNETITILDDTVTSVIGRNNDILIPPDGLPLLVYEDGEADTMKVIKCNDPACSGGDEMPLILDNPGTIIGIEAALVIGVDGNPLVAYWDLGPNQLRVVQCNDPNCAGQDETSRIIAVAKPNPTGTGSGLDLVIGVDGLPLISFFDAAPPRTLGILRCGRSDCAPFATP